MRFWKRNTSPRRGTRQPLFALLILAPLCGEMLSGSMPPLAWLDPFGVAILIMLYGSGAVLVRELVRRWGQGWPSILLLGLAYGIYEEGIVVRSFFDPAWQDLDILAWYGRWLGVNWIWTIELTLFHAVVSIAIPVLLVELAFPAQRNRLWVTRRGLKVHALMFASLMIIGTAFEMHAPPLGYVGCGVAIVVLAGLAYRWPERDPAPDREPPRQWIIALTGFVGMVGFIITLWIIPALEPPALLSLIACVFWPLIVLWRVRRLGRWSWGARQQWALAAGALAVWILLAFLMAAGPSMPLAGLLFVWILWRVRRRIRVSELPVPSVAQLAPPPALSSRAN